MLPRTFSTWPPLIPVNTACRFCCPGWVSGPSPFRSISNFPALRIWLLVSPCSLDTGSMKTSMHRTQPPRFVNSGGDGKSDLSSGHSDTSTVCSARPVQRARMPASSRFLPLPSWVSGMEPVTPSFCGVCLTASSCWQRALWTIPRRFRPNF